MGTRQPNIQRGRRLSRSDSRSSERGLNENFLCIANGVMVGLSTDVAMLSCDAGCMVVLFFCPSMRVVGGTMVYRHSGWAQKWAQKQREACGSAGEVDKRRFR